MKEDDSPTNRKAPFVKLSNNLFSWNDDNDRVIEDPQTTSIDTFDKIFFQ